MVILMNWLLWFNFMKVCFQLDHKHKIWKGNQSAWLLFRCTGSQSCVPDTQVQAELKQGQIWNYLLSWILNVSKLCLFTMTLSKFYSRLFLFIDTKRFDCKTWPFWNLKNILPSAVENLKWRQEDCKQENTLFLSLIEG